MNAYFYAAWMIASFVFIIPTSFTMVLYAAGAAEPAALAQKTRLTLKLSAGIGSLACLGLWIGADYVLGLFKPAYIEQAEWCLRILGLAVFPLMIKSHYTAICRVQGRIPRTALLMALGGVLELVLAGIGVSLGGLTGLSIGWVTAISIEAVCMLPVVYRIWTSDDIRPNQLTSEIVPPGPSPSVYPAD
jgi:O-antigen/teichoic acid export membrane protein